MPTQSQKSSGGGIGFGGVLLLVFVTLKLCGVIAWSWWWVMSPFWIPCLIALCALLIYAFLAK